MGCTCHSMCVRPKGNLQDVVLSFYHDEGSRDETWVIRVGSKHPYLLGHFARPLLFYLFYSVNIYLSCVCVCIVFMMCACMWKSEDNVLESVFSFYREFLSSNLRSAGWAARALSAESSCTEPPHTASFFYFTLKDNPVYSNNRQVCNKSAPLTVLFHA